MNGLGQHCEMCGNSLCPTTVPRECPGCVRRHRLCLVCEIGEEMVDTSRADSIRLTTCPDALKVAKAVMREEMIPAKGRRIRMSVDSGPSLPAAGSSGQLFFRTADSGMFRHDGRRWVRVGDSP